jgi:glycosyltransferase involved in cell wall biosynthesis
MLISGFTFVRNVEKMNYPLLEAISSILPICDEFIVNVCESEDRTFDIVSGINSDKIKIVRSIWDKSAKKDGLAISQNTNIALDSCRGEWCFYIQADEVVHEEDLSNIKSFCERCLYEERVEGFLFDYLHFYGSYNVIATAKNWYRKEVRIVRNNIGAKSFGDGQGFKIKGEKPGVIDTKARVFHYGWVKSPLEMGIKNKHFFRLWHGNKYDNAFNNFQYEQQYGLKYFTGNHPLVMKNRISFTNYKFEIDKTKIKWTLKNLRYLLSDMIERLTGIRFFEHKNYKLAGR